MLTKVLRELRPSKMKPSFPDGTIFARSQWQHPQKYGTSVWMAAFRGFMSVAMIIIVAVSLSDVGRGPAAREDGKNLTTNEIVAHYLKWFVYLTNWGLLLDMAQFIMGFAIIMKRRKLEKNTEPQQNGSAKPADVSTPQKGVSPKREGVAPILQNSDGDHLPIAENKLCAAYWICNTVALDVAIGISCTYWVTVYNPKDDALDFLNFLGHVINSVFMFLDLLVNAHPVPFMHFVWPMLFVFIFLAFSVVYWAAGGTDRLLRPYLYSILDWSHPLKTTIVCILGLLFVAFVHFCMCTIASLRRCIGRRVFARTDANPKTNGVHLTSLPA